MHGCVIFGQLKFGSTKQVSFKCEQNEANKAWPVTAGFKDLLQDSGCPKSGNIRTSLASLPDKNRNFLRITSQSFD
jgi:hypothetical protein